MEGEEGADMKHQQITLSSLQLRQQQLTEKAETQRLDEMEVMEITTLNLIIHIAGMQSLSNQLLTALLNLKDKDKSKLQLYGINDIPTGRKQ